MLTYDTLAHKPGAFTSMTGLTVQEFEELLADLRPRYEAARQEESAARSRRRARGGGAKPRYALRERLLLTLVWLRLYLTCEAVGVLFAVDKSTVSRYTRPLPRLLRDHGQDTLGWPIVVQNTLAEMKHVRILADVFRHALDFYDSIFVSIAGIVTRRAAQGLAELGRAALPVAA